jgi:hypothetical protein
MSKFFLVGYQLFSVPWLKSVTPKCVECVFVHDSSTSGYSDGLYQYDVGLCLDQFAKRDVSVADTTILKWLVAITLANCFYCKISGNGWYGN